MGKRKCSLPPEECFGHDKACLRIPYDECIKGYMVAALQASEDLYTVLDERRQLLLCLSDSSALAASDQPPSQSQLASAAAAAEKQLRSLLFIIENALAVLFFEFWRCLPHPDSGGGNLSDAPPSAAEQQVSVFVDRAPTSTQLAKGRQRLGSDRDLDQLRRLLQPVLDHLAALSEEDMPQEGSSVQVLSRRLKEFVALL